MSKNTVPKIDVQGFDELFGTDMIFNGNSEIAGNYPVIDVSLNKLHSFTDHPFKVKDDEKMQDLIDSIQVYGVIYPIIAREHDGSYEIISGHRRKYACEKLGMHTIPVRVVELDDDDATILMVQSNFCQREELLPSEKAKGYRKEYDAKKHRGSKGGITVEKMGEATGESASTVKLFIKLSYLIDDLLELLDAEKLGIRQGYNLAFLSESNQKLICDFLQTNGVILSLQQSSEIKSFASEKELTKEIIEEILSPKKKKKRSFAMKSSMINKFFPEHYSNDQIAEIIFKLLDEWKELNNES